MTNVYNRLLPTIVGAIQVLGKTDEEKAIECFEILDDMCEYSITILVNYVKSIVETCLTIANDITYGVDFRRKAVLFMGWLAKTKKKSLIKHKLLEPTIGIFLKFCLPICVLQCCFISSYLVQFDVNEAGR